MAAASSAVTDSTSKPLGEEVDETHSETTRKQIARGSDVGGPDRSQEAGHRSGGSDRSLGSALRPGERFDDDVYYQSPEIAILLACVRAFEDGTLKENQANLRDIALMIRKSSNATATRMIAEVGGLTSTERVLTIPTYAWRSDVPSICLAASGRLRNRNGSFVSLALWKLCQSRAA